jgi:glycosyltransferase involved in cell wall biosynthesis
MLPPPPAGKTGWPWQPKEFPPLPALPAGAAWPKISVVTTLYNQAEFIEETIRSVLLQGYPNLEFIIINDSSTDGGLAVVEKYGQWIRIVNRPRGSQYNALNHGFRLATGDLIAWQNSDDLFGEGSLAIGALAALQNPDASIIHGNTKCFWDFNIAGPYAVEVCEEFSSEAFLDRMCIMNQSMLFRRRIFDEGVFVREDMRFGGDQEFFWQLAMNGYRFKLVPQMVGYYRWHRAAITFSPLNVIKADREIFRMQRGLFHDKRLTVEMRRKIRRKLWVSLFSAFKKCRRNILYKIVPELFSVVRA